MKKIFAYLLLAALILGLCGCSGKVETTNSIDSKEEFPPAVLGEGLNVGYGRVNITPSYDIGLGGYADSSTRISNKVLDEVAITCIAFTEGEQTFLLFTMDNAACSASFAEEFRGWVTYATKVPAENQFYGATHTHSAPSSGVNGENGEVYSKLMFDGAMRAAKIAMSDRAPATTYAATPNLQGMNFVRHYTMADGTVAGSNFGSFTNSEIVGHVAEPDDQMVLVKFDRVEKDDILLVNWQAHPDHTSKIGYHVISADFPGAMRKKLADDTGMLVAYFTGASGNLNPLSKIKEEDHGLSMQAYGEKLAELAQKALADMKPVEGSGMAAMKMPYIASIDHSWDHRLEDAQEVFDLWQTEGNKKGTALAWEYGFSSVYQASAILTRSQLGPAQTVDCAAFRIGGIGFVNAPYEMFSASGEYIKENSPTEVTFIVTGNNGYIPTTDAFEYNSYEAVTGRFAAGTAEGLADHFLWLMSLIA